MRKFSCGVWQKSITGGGYPPLEEYKEYVKACEAECFTVDYSRDDAYYSALNADGYKLTLRYLGLNKIEVSLKAPEGGAAGSDNTDPVEDTTPAETTKPSEETEPVEDTQPSNELVNGMRPEFKEAMDSYEAFFDEYCAFMEKYIASDGSDVSLSLDYANYMSKYAEMMADFEAWEDEEMNDAETAYYIQVQTRINEKLLEVAQ